MTEDVSSLPNDAFQRLREAIALGDADAIRAALPEPPTFLATLFSLKAPDRDNILAGVFSALDTDEDRWEIIEASAMDTIVNPERRSFISVVKYVPETMRDDARNLIKQFRDATAADEARRAFDARS